ncbi:sensor histidine kinase [Arcobacter sp. FWKO B]|uniref:HAMP domain-containing sensor histidine kinase n=1 Tax=Arcobacter sp. FWKO B TaxID=2593672 RepID=UPI0018A3A94F|nr:HAMP domain-containing sensor histidine kinase [Arcobacter sp. FWKO B]QOG12652.1 HAMP domain-containing histidine kinase [Arcobacter sp. FWKO B]
MKTISIYKEFYTKLIIATSLFILTLFFIFYGFTRATIYEEIRDEMMEDAQLIYRVSFDVATNQPSFTVITSSNVYVDLVTVKNLTTTQFKEYKKGNETFVELLYPFNLADQTFIKIVKNTTSHEKMLSRISNNLIFLIVGGAIMIILYALAISKTLLLPILQLTNKLSKMNENFLVEINTKTLPIEFHPLANSINNLTNRIKTFVKYQKELFIGSAHELKTPLAVMKLKNEVTLKKKRELEQYEDVLRLNINSINDMNKMITSFLDIGRQEGAQFEKPIELDMIDFLDRRIKDYRLLTTDKNITLEFVKNCDTFITIIQPTLVLQIIQNFVQNAIKFSPNNSKIQVVAKKKNDTLKISVIDEGSGIDESVDLFAPFKRIGNSAGAGLGLFLAKSAADALGAVIGLRNRKDGISGTVAFVILYSNPACKVGVGRKT